jgi:hypothetical protein
MGHQHGVGVGRIETNGVWCEAFSVENCNVKICRSIWDIILNTIYEKLFNLYSECLNKEALDGPGDFKFGGQIIQTVKYADDLVLMAKEETVLQGMIDILI